MNEVEYERMQEDAAMGDYIAENLQAILDSYGATNVAELYRTIYKSTDCGPWLSVQTHGNEWMHSDQLEGVDNGNVRALLIGSIVEGSEAEVKGDVLDLMKFETPADALAAFEEQLEEVNAAACELSP